MHARTAPAVSQSGVRALSGERRRRPPVAARWRPTAPGRAWFTYFRLYAPLEPFDASWKLPDTEAA